MSSVVAGGFAFVSVVAWAAALRSPQPMRRVTALRSDSSGAGFERVPARHGESANHGRATVGWVGVAATRIIGLVPKQLRMALVVASALICVHTIFSPLLSLAVVGGVALAGRSVRSFRVRRASRRVDSALIPFIEHLARGLRSGESPVRALEEAGQSQLAVSSFAALARDCRSGVGFTGALYEWEQRQSSNIARQLSQVLRFGDSLGAVRPQFVDSVLATLHEEQNLNAEVRALSDQARYSASVMVAAPLLFSAGLVGTDAHARHLLLHTNIGGVLLMLGAALDIAGFAWMQHLTRKVASS